MEAFTIVCRYAAEGDSLEQICALCLWMLADAASLTSLPNP